MENIKDICLACGGKIVPAGTSNQIDGRRFNGIKELADEQWVVCEDCYKQDERGDWHYND